MTVKLIKEAPKTYDARCMKCGARFSYELGDVRQIYYYNKGTVACPSCGESHHHPRQDGCWP